MSAIRAGGHAWDGGARGWDVYYAVILAGVLVLVTITQTRAQLAAAPRLVTSLALLAMVPWYLAYRRSVLHADASLGRQLVFLAGLWVLFTVASSQGVVDSFLLLALCPLCFMAAPFRWAVGAIVLLNVTPVAIVLIRGGSTSDLVTLTASGALIVAFSVVLGSWTYRIIDQSLDRANLIEQLSQTRAELATANREAGTLAERQRLASEIHDTVAQGFTSIIMLLQAADTDLGRDTAATRRHLALALSTARENLAEARALVAALAPAGLESAALDGALRRLTEATAGELGIIADFGTTGEACPLRRPAEVVLLRVCQEALANVRKHARAQRVQVTLGYAGGLVVLEVTDDGCGFRTGQAAAGYGLRGMRARVADEGGKFAVRSAPGAGTTVRAEVPLLAAEPGGPW